jgi:hypothetical protein
MSEGGQTPEKPMAIGGYVDDSEYAKLDTPDYKIDLKEVERFAQILKKHGAKFVADGVMGQGQTFVVTSITAIPPEDNNGK